MKKTEKGGSINRGYHGIELCVDVHVRRRDADLEAFSAMLTSNHNLKHYQPTIKYMR